MRALKHLASFLKTEALTPTTPLCRLFRQVASGSESAAWAELDATRRPDDR
jgi:hypothetical protein